MNYIHIRTHRSEMGQAHKGNTAAFFGRKKI